MSMDATKGSTLKDTMSMDIAKRIEFVQRVELHHKPLHESLLARSPESRTLTEGKAEADVVAGEIVAFTAKLSGQVKQDIKDATLFAQLAANKKANRDENTDEWYKQYVHVLENIGFVIQEFDITQYDTSGQTFRMDKAVLDILKAATTRSGMAVANAAIDALGKLPGDSTSVVLFENQSSSLNKGNFQIAACDQDANGDVTIALGAFHFTADKRQTRFLWWSWSSNSISMYQGSQTLVLNEGVYGQVRHHIQNKLGNKAETFVLGIEI